MSTWQLHARFVLRTMSSFHLALHEAKFLHSWAMVGRARWGGETWWEIPRRSGAWWGTIFSNVAVELGLAFTTDYGTLAKTKKQSPGKNFYTSKQLCKIYKLGRREIFPVVRARTFPVTLRIDVSSKTRKEQNTLESFTVQLLTIV